MNCHYLGNSDLHVSTLSLGSYMTIGEKLDLQASKMLIDTAMDLGINFFDTASTYAQGQAEEYLGKCLNSYPRSDWMIATKCFFPMSKLPNDKGLSRVHIQQSVENSLRRLSVDYIDLMQCHRFDPSIPVEETIQTLEELVAQGKIRYWGVTRFSYDEFEQYLHVKTPVSHQVAYSLAYRNAEKNLFAQAIHANTGIIAHSPLAQGILTGKYQQKIMLSGARAEDEQAKQSMRHLTDGTSEKTLILTKIAKQQLGITPSQLAIACCLNQSPINSVLLGASTPLQLVENVAATDIQLQRDILDAIRDLFPLVIKTRK